MAILAFSQDGKYLSAALGGLTRAWQDWNTASPKQVAHGNVPVADDAEAIALTPGGRYHAAAKRKDKGGDGVEVSDLLARREVVFIPYDEEVNDVALSPDGRFLAIGSNGTAQLWNIALREKVFSIQVPCAEELTVGGVVLSPEGRYLATVNDQQTIQVWYCRHQDLIAEAQKRVSRNLSREEWKQYFDDLPPRETFTGLPVADESE
jgi:WD40 repeat protein